MNAQSFAGTMTATSSLGAHPAHHSVPFDDLLGDPLSDSAHLLALEVRRELTAVVWAAVRARGSPNTRVWTRYAARVAPATARLCARTAWCSTSAAAAIHVST